MKYALCNELFGEMELDRAAGITRLAGYGGIEFAPYTVFGSFTPADMRSGVKTISKALADNDLAFAGFHWLLASSRPMSLVSPDRALRDAALERLRLLLQTAGELGGGVLVLGSPQQRNSVPGQGAAAAKDALRDSLASLGDYAVSCNATLLLEALDHGQCDVVNTLAEAEELVRAAASPGIGGMFDFHNAGDESESWENLIRGYAGFIKHVHINEWDGGPSGTGASDYGPAFRALRETAFDGWVSMEIFSRPADAEAAVTKALAFMKKTEAGRKE